MSLLSSALSSLRGQQYDNCGRPLNPDIGDWLPFPRIIPFQGVYTGDPVIATQKRVSNTSPYTLWLTGIAIDPTVTAGVSFRVKWPNGHYLNQSSLAPVSAGGTIQGPIGQAGNQFAFPELIEIPPGGRIAVENSGVAGTLNLAFWGFLQVPVERLPASAKQSALLVRQKLDQMQTGGADATQCLIGYPAGKGCLIGYPIGNANSAAKAAGSSGAGFAAIVGRHASAGAIALEKSLRWQCNRNIMLPEWAQGNQCQTLTPAGFDGTPFTLFSDPATLAVDAQSSNVPLVVPGDQGTRTILRRMRVITTWANATGIPTVAIRLPNGYSITGGDQIPLTPSQWMPLFPRVGVAAGTRLLLDWGNQQGAGAGTLTTYLEFDCVKLRPTS